jgi:glutamate-1-semialdehyde 2,1-aminomutase
MIDRTRLDSLRTAEEERFRESHPRSAELAREADHSLLAGVPMPWMTRWAGSFPLFVDSAGGARFTDVDGLEYVDLCLGDTGAMTGHALPSVASAVQDRAAHGFTTMMPSSDAAWVGEELRRRFGLDRWQFAMTATDANRFVLRFARHLTGRPKVAVMDWCYHGTVDETLAVLDGDRVVPRPGALGPQVDVALTTRVVPFNDLDALDAALAHGDVAALLMEPALTNIGMILPDEGYLARVRELTREHGVLWVVDETHTLCAGPGGMTVADGLEPDVVTMGKAIGGGIPCGAFGMTAELADRVRRSVELEDIDVGGIGGTLAGNALSLAAMRATLAHVLTDEAYAHMLPLGLRWADGVAEVLRRRQVPWHVTRLGARAEYAFAPEPARSGREAAEADDFALQTLLHLHALNRRLLLTPFHNMALMAPTTTEADVDRHTAAFDEALADLTSS